MQSYKKRNKKGKKTVLETETINEKGENDESQNHNRQTLEHGKLKIMVPVSKRGSLTIARIGIDYNMEKTEISFKLPDEMTVEYIVFQRN